MITEKKAKCGLANATFKIVGLTHKNSFQALQLVVIIFPIQLIATQLKGF